MANKIVKFRVMGVDYEFNTQLNMIRRVGGYWMAMDHVAKGIKDCAKAAQKLKECLL